VLSTKLKRKKLSSVKEILRYLNIINAVDFLGRSCPRLPPPEKDKLITEVQLELDLELLGQFDDVSA